jgi:DNA-directed RNA polymerase subunit RPC12/RpoP
MIAHDYKGTVVSPTCTEQGYTKYKCSMCTSTKANDNYTPALGHEYESEIIIAPTYTAPGTMNYSCVRCDDYYTEAIARKRGAVQINTTTGHRPHLAYVKKANGWVLCVPNVRKSNNEWNPCG